MSAVNEMLVNLEDQVRVYRKLTDLTRNQIMALRSRDVRGVHAVLQEIELAMLERVKVERARSETMEAVSNELGVALEDIDVQIVVAHADQPVGQVMLTVAGELRQLVWDLDVLVSESQAILQQELSLIDLAIDTITVSGHEPGYERQGGRGVVRRNVLDAQV